MDADYPTPDHPILGREEELRLFAAYHAGRHLIASKATDFDPAEAEIRAAAIAARDELVRCNQGLVANIANRFTRQRREWFDDAMSCGQLGLLRAIGRFDPSRGNKFITVAYFWIRHFIQRGYNETGRTVRVPTHAVVDGVRTLAHHMGGLDSFEWIAQEETPGGPFDARDCRRLRDEIDLLPEAARMVVLARMDGRMFHEISRESGLSRQTACNIYHRALKWLRRELSDVA